LLILAKENEQIQSILNQSDENAILFHGVTAANSTKLNQTAGNKWVALGDAAISFDPLSSQGMFNAMACAMQLRNLIVEFGFTEQLQQHYSNQIVSIWHRYLQHKDLFYSQEQRWKSHEFWKRRHSNRKYP
jgi:flavin-dependent dehydrogenase